MTQFETCPRPDAGQVAAGSADSAADTVTVSVALTTYNGARFLPCQLDSLLHQTTAPFELVVSDDGSSDTTLELLDEYAKTAPFPVRICRNAIRLGYKANFMHAISLCRGEVVAFCDQDDLWRSDKIAAVASSFRAGVTMVFHRTSLIDANGAVLGSFRQESGPMRFPTFRTHSPFRYPLGFSMAVRRSLDAFSDLHRNSVDFYQPDQPMAHDQWFSSLAFLLGEVLYLDEELVAYRQHGSNLFGVDQTVLRKKSERRPLSRWLNAETDYRPLASTLQSLSLCAEQIEARLPIGSAGEIMRVKLAIARTELSRLTELYRLRARTYSAPAVVSRLSAWIQLLRARAYVRGARWRFHRKFLIVDLLSGVMLARLAEGSSVDLKGDRTLETPEAPEIGDDRSRCQTAISSPRLGP